MIACVLEEHSDIHHACNLFAMIGAAILREHYRLDAVAVSGAAFFCIGSDANPLAFAEIREGQIVAGLGGFHSWIECKGYAVDFLSLLFPENVAEFDNRIVVPRRAFMRPLSLMATRFPEKSDPPGTFLLIPDEACIANMVQTFYRKPVSGDLQTICSTWYKRPPKAMEADFQIRDNHGHVTTLHRKSLDIRGVW